MNNPVSDDFILKKNRLRHFVEVNCMIQEMFQKLVVQNNVVLF